MFKLFKNTNVKKTDLNFADMDGNPLKEGDEVYSFRYEMGKCRIIKGKEGFEYLSLEKGTRVHWLRMVDAATKNQKVRKID